MDAEEDADVVVALHVAGAAVEQENTFDVVYVLGVDVKSHLVQELLC